MATFSDPIRTTGVTCGWRDTSAVSDRQWPWHVMIVEYNRCICGGTLIAPGLVVTSSLCLPRVWVRNVQVGRWNECFDGGVV